MTQPDSKAYFKEALSYLPGGVNSPVRAFGAVGGSPIFFEKAAGAYLYDVNQKQYIDYVGSWGPMILGHSHPTVVQAVCKAAQSGLSFGAACPLEIDLAKAITQVMPSIEKVRMVNSGTEAAMTAIRLARGYTGRDKILKFIGCYHGHTDALLVKAGSGGLTFNQPDSAGVPAAVTQDTLLAHYNDTDAVSALFAAHGETIAAVILEPIAGNMGMVLPELSFLHALKDQCEQHGAVLIFDEVMTGFRVALGGAQACYDIRPDLTMLGKVIGGGCPVGAVGGRAEIMDYLSPLGPVYQAGTLSGNPLAMAAGLATLTALIETPDFYRELSDKTECLALGLKTIANAHGHPCQVSYRGGMFGFCFTDQPTVHSLSDVQTADFDLFNRFFHAMLAQGVYFAPSAYEAGFVSQAHTPADIERTLSLIETAFSAL